MIRVDRVSVARLSSTAGWCVSILAALVAAGARAADDDVSRFDFSGTQRSRYESIDPQFRPNLSESDRLLALQTSLVFDVTFSKLKFFAEIVDSRGALNDTGSFVSGTIVNALEPQQTYVAWNLDGSLQDGSKSTLRVGRMTIDLGRRRVLSRSRFSNAVAGFAGADWDWRGADGREARAFYFIPMRPLPADTDSLLDDDYELDRGTRGTALTGFYYQLPPFANKSVLELYVLDFDVDPPRLNLATAVDLQTFGARIYRNSAPGKWSYEVEPIFQLGESADAFAGATRTGLDHRAYYLHLETGYSFDKKWAPILLLQYTLASGDEDPTDTSIERFNSLFGDRRFEFGPTDIYGAISRSNVDMLGLRLTFRPQPRWQAMIHYADVRLAQARDAWVGSGWRDPSGASGEDVGRQLETSFTWAAIKDRLSVETGFAHFDLGRFPQQSAGAAFRGDPTFFYTTLTTTF